MDKETENYFYGEKPAAQPAFSPEVFAEEIAKEDPKVLKEKLHTLEEDIKHDIENEIKQRTALASNIERDALIDEVRDADSIHALHESQRKIIKEALKSKERKSKLRTVLGTFFGF